jgi:hypothetical protein
METPINVMISQSQSDLLQHKHVPELPQGINEFLFQLNKLMGRLNQETENYEDMANTYAKILRFANRPEANNIVDLHKSVYHNHYPYHEMLDPQYIGEFVGNHNNGICSLYGCKEKEIAGCGMMMVDAHDHTGYMRGLMVLPEFQGKIDIKTGVMTTVAYGYAKYKGSVHKWYTETRTAHSKAQYLMESVGLRPCGIFPNKDVFFGGTKRESDVLEVSYFDDTLFSLRNPTPKILPQLADLFMFAAQRFMLQFDIDYEEPMLEFDNKSIDQSYNMSKNIHVTKIDGQYNTVKYELITPRGSWMRFMVTKTVASAEKTEIYINDPFDLAAILIKLKEVIIEDHLEYFEIYLPTTDSTLQAIFLNLGFSVFGYVPAWKENKDGLLDDCIIFGLYQTPINEEEIKLTQFGNEFLELIEPYLHDGVSI